MRGILEYLYCKYYHFQGNIGNAIVAPFGAIMFIGLTCYVYCISILLFLTILFPKNNLIANSRFIAWFSIGPSFVLIAVLYFLLIRKGKYKEVLKRGNAKYKSSFGAILFALAAFILFNAGWILKMLQNQGRF
ncbi:MAG: hypothetical protein GC178_01870 [Flavobacteriales bacterium]|nr:hypothetical protein [Flavobacteriales bacterium]